MNEFLANPTLPISALYYAVCILNFMAALWMASAYVQMRGTDMWLFRILITVAGLVHAIITISMYKNPEYAPIATHLIWWWAIAVLGILAIAVNFTDAIPNVVMRFLSYIAAGLAYWGAYMVFTEQNAFGELATYYGFFAANLGAAIWTIGHAISSPDMLRVKRLIFFGVGAVYALLVMIAVPTMQMILVTPYD